MVLEAEFLERVVDSMVWELYFSDTPADPANTIVRVTPLVRNTTIDAKGIAELIQTLEKDPVLIGNLDRAPPS